MKYFLSESLAYYEIYKTIKMTTFKKLTIAKNLCLLPGLFLVVSGLLLLFFPDGASVLFDIKNLKTFDEPSSLAMGIRQFSIGLMITALVFSKQSRALGMIMLIGGIVPLTDFFIFSKSIGWISALRHLASAPFIFGLGLYLIYISRKSD